MDYKEKKYEYIHRFRKLGLGLFVHFGLYSIPGKGEWYLRLSPEADEKKYRALTGRFRVNKNWAGKLVKTAKAVGAKYITLTTRHHDGFSLYDTCGLNGYDAPHSACGRDLVAEFVSSCRESGIVPFFYHTLLDWSHPAYREDFPAYIDYLVKSIEILCRNYGPVGGFWFDGMWDKPEADWQEDRLYAMIRKYQPDAMLINNTGLSAAGRTGHRELDGVTFERGQARKVQAPEGTDKPIAGEMCQVLNDHWGYAKNDCNYKSVKELIGNLVDCRANNCNFLLNTGLRGNGSVNPTDKCLLGEVGKWIRSNHGFIYWAEAAEIGAENAVVLKDEKHYYAVIKGVEMSADPNVQQRRAFQKIKIGAPVRRAEWLDSGEPAEAVDGCFDVAPFSYGSSLSVRVLKFDRDEKFFEKTKDEVSEKLRESI